MKTIGKLALSGLVTLLPVALTLYIIWWLGSGAEALLGGFLRKVIGEDLYVPGAGLVLGLGLLIGVGFLMRAVLARKVAAAVDRLVERIPLVKTVYGSLRDLLSLFSKKPQERIDRVVLVTFADTRLRMLGLVTRSEMPEIDAGVQGDPVVAVYIPMSYGVGGYTVLVPSSTLTPLSMSVEEALRFAITAGAPSKSA